MASKRSLLSEVYEYNQKQVARTYGVNPSAVGDSTFQQTQLQHQQIKTSVRSNMKILDLLYSNNDHIQYTVFGFGSSGKSDLKYHYGLKTTYERMDDIIRNMSIDLEVDRYNQLVNTRITTHV